MSTWAEDYYGVIVDIFERRIPDEVARELAISMANRCKCLEERVKMAERSACDAYNFAHEMEATMRHGHSDGGERGSGVKKENREAPSTPEVKKRCKKGALRSELLKTTWVLPCVLVCSPCLAAITV